MPAVPVQSIDLGKPIGEAYNSKLKAVQTYRRVAGNVRNVTSIKCEKNGKLVREIKFYAEGDKIIIEEYELKKGNKGDEYMAMVFCNVHEKHHYARSEFIGRVCCIGLEHANNGYDSEFLNSIYAK